jgi:ankyrin repeat protein
MVSATGFSITQPLGRWTLDSRDRTGRSPNNAQNATGETALFAAIKTDSPSTISVLLNLGHHPLFAISLGNTALHAAVRWNAKKAAAALLAGGADPNSET